MPDFTKSAPGWYCFKALPKKEHIASELLRREAGMDTLCPRIAYLKKTRRGKVRFVECLFPGYVFIKADLAESYRRIRATQGIRDIVSFGGRCPEVPEAFIDELRSRLDEENLKAIPEPVVKPGQEVTIMEGPFKDWNAIVTGQLDARQRVGLLLDFLGRQMEIRVAVEDVMVESDAPKGRVWEE
jgi:transcriptional antiterminator RfaH